MHMLARKHSRAVVPDKRLSLVIASTNKSTVKFF